VNRLETVGEFLVLLKENRNWWLFPIAIVLLIMGVLLAVAGGSAIAPFIYTIF
jgi:hypothetical protein